MTDKFDDDDCGVPPTLSPCPKPTDLTLSDYSPELTSLLNAATIKYSCGDKQFGRLAEDSDYNCCSDFDSGSAEATQCLVLFGNGSEAKIDHLLYFQGCCSDTTFKISFKPGEAAERNKTSWVELLHYEYGDCSNDQREAPSRVFQIVKKCLSLSTTTMVDFIAALVSRAMPMHQSLSTGGCCFEPFCHEDTPVFLKAKRLLAPSVDNIPGKVDPAEFVIHVEKHVRTPGFIQVCSNTVFLRVKKNTRLSSIATKYLEHESVSLEKVVFVPKGGKINVHAKDDPTVEDMGLDEENYGIEIWDKKESETFPECFTVKISTINNPFSAVIDLTTASTTAGGFSQEIDLTNNGSSSDNAICLD